MRYNEPNLATSASPHATEVRMTMIIVPWTKVINSIYLHFFAQDAYFPLFFMIVGKVFVHQESAGCSAWQVPIVKIVSKLIFKQNWTGLWIEHMHTSNICRCVRKEKGEVDIWLIFGAFFIIYMLKRGRWAGGSRKHRPGLPPLRHQLCPWTRTWNPAQESASE